MINCKITLKLRLFCAIMGEIGEIGCFFEREVTRKEKNETTLRKKHKSSYNLQKNVFLSSYNLKKFPKCSVIVF